MASGLTKYNIILGKNGSGKSTLLRHMDRHLRGGNGCIKYITPERGGELNYDGNIETNSSSNPHWLTEVRRRNRFDQFRQSSVSEFRNLETLVLRSIEIDRSVRSSDFTFESVISKINDLLDNVRLERSDNSSLRMVRKVDGAAAAPSDLSSGESELISLSVEILSFSYACKQERYSNTDNWLLLDEPDVHLHPDLQHRLIKLLVENLNDSNGKVVIATHSTTILSSLCDESDQVGVAFRSSSQQGVFFRRVTDATRAILPMFGAHPLSNIFNRRPPLIVEGEDEERIWQSAIRSSNGRVSVYPCVAGDIQSMHDYESTASDIIESVYDNATAYSLRDRDVGTGDISDIGAVKRFKLNCRSSENLLLTDDALEELGISWNGMQDGVSAWIDANPHHVRVQDAISFRDSGWDRREFNLKKLRMVIVGISGSTKSWEVAVGRAIAKLNQQRFSGPNSLRDYLGGEFVAALRLI